MTKDAAIDHLLHDNECQSKVDENTNSSSAYKKLYQAIANLSVKVRPKFERKVRFSSRALTNIDVSEILEHVGDKSLKKVSAELKTCKKPLGKQAGLREKRAAAYEVIANDVNKWEKLVHNHRKAEQLVFEEDRVTLRTIEKTQPICLRTKLQQDIYLLLQGTKVNEKKETEEEKSIRKAMSLEEIRERTRKMWREREMKKRIEHKAHMQNKSKSRRYHRILRRERLRKQREELRKLQETDPEAALKVIDELNKARIAERMTLRHKYSKWAHMQGERGRRDHNVKAALEENTKIHQELLQKLRNSVEEEDEEMDNDEQVKVADAVDNPNNPWNVSTESAIKTVENKDNFVSYRKFWEEVNLRKLEEIKAQKLAEEKLALEQSENNSEMPDNCTVSTEDVDAEVDDIIKETIIKNIKNEKLNSVTKIKKRRGKKKSKKILDESEQKNVLYMEHDFTLPLQKLEDELQDNLENLSSTEKAVAELQQVNKINEDCRELIKNADSKKVESTVDPSKFIQVKSKVIHTAMPDVGFNGDEDSSNDEDSNENNQDIIREAFADDYLIDEFKSEKKKFGEKEKEICLALPGWGSWTGPGIKMSKRKIKKFTLRIPKKIKGVQFDNVIYNEEADLHKNLRKNLVNEIPYPFTSVKDFEASIRAPVTRNFVPEIVHKKLTAPAVVTKMGHIIEPMDERVLSKTYLDTEKTTQKERHKKPPITVNGKKQKKKKKVCNKN